MIRYLLLKLPSKHLTLVTAITALLAVPCATSAHADNNDWQLHGTLTQAVIYTSDNNFYGHSDDNDSWKFTEINLNASARLLPNLRAAGQILYRQAGAQGEGGGVDYAILDYQFFTETAFTAGVRGGRYKLPIGLYNETRDVAFTRPSIYAPQSAYPDRARDLELSSDGALLYTDIFTDTGQWTLELDAGRPRIDKQTLASAYSFIPGDVAELGRRVTYGGRIMYQSSDGKWLAALSHAEAKMRYQQALQPSLKTGIDTTFIYWIASLQCNVEQWTFTTEYGHIDATLDSDLFSASLHPLFYYVQATRHLDKHWSVYSRYDNLYWDRHDPSGNNYAALVGVDNFVNFSHDYGFGARYDINSNAMLSAEYHYINGTAFLSETDNPNTTTRYWNMVAVEFSFRF